MSTKIIPAPAGSTAGQLEEEPMILEDIGDHDVAIKNGDFTWSRPSAEQDGQKLGSNSGKYTSEKTNRNHVTTKKEIGVTFADGESNLDSPIHNTEFLHEYADALHRKNVRKSRSFAHREKSKRKIGTGFGKQSEWDKHIVRLNGLLSNEQVATLTNDELWQKAIEGRWKEQRIEPSSQSDESRSSSSVRRSSSVMTPFKTKNRKRSTLTRNPTTVERKNKKRSSFSSRKLSVSSEHSDNKKSGVNSNSVFKTGQVVAQGLPDLASELKSMALSMKREKWTMKYCLQCVKDFRIYPQTTLHSVWAVFTIIFVVWTGLTLPVTVAIIHGSGRPQWWKVIDVMADYFFTIDVVLNFRSVYLDAWGAMVVDSGRIAHHYLFGDSGTSLGWFWIDVPAAIPWTLFPISIRGVRDPALMFNLPKLLRIFQLPEQIGQLPCAPKDSSSQGRISRLFGLFVIVAHWFGCLWYWVGMSELCREPCRESSGGDANGHCSWIEANDFGHIPAEQLYVKSLYWAITTMTSVGYGDISPINMAETLTSSVIMLIGSAMYATIFSNMASYIQSIDADVADFQQKMRDIRQQMKYLRIPKELRGHIEMYYNYMWTCHKGLVEHKQYFYKDLPPALNLEISMHLFQDLVREVKLFKNCSNAFLREVVLHLEPQVCIPGEYIVNKNDVARAMFFITRGEVEVLDGMEGKHLAFLHAPQYFGETAILEARRRTASIQALTYADLYFLLASKMQVILQSFEEDDEIIHRNALAFLNHGEHNKPGNHRSTYQFMSKSDMQHKRAHLEARINKHRKIPVTIKEGTE